MGTQFEPSAGRLQVIRSILAFILCDLTGILLLKVRGTGHQHPLVQVGAGCSNNMQLAHHMLHSGAHVRVVLLLHPAPTCTNGCWCPVPPDLQQRALVVIFIHILVIRRILLPFLIPFESHASVQDKCYGRTSCKWKCSTRSHVCLHPMGCAIFLLKQR